MPMTEVLPNGFTVKKFRDEYLPDDCNDRYDGAWVRVGWWNGPVHEFRRVYVPADCDTLVYAYDFALDYLYQEEGLENLEYSNCDVEEICSI